MRSAILSCFLAVGGNFCYALNPALDISQYGHTAWTVRDGFSLGNVYAMAQTPDGYLWLGGEFGLFRFDGVRSVRWQPPAGQHLPDKNINSLLVSRDGTLWIGTFAGLVTWNKGTLTVHSEPGPQFIASLYEDREGTVWVGTLETPTGRLYAFRSGGARRFGEDDSFGRAVWSLYEDSSGNLWAAAQSGLLRIKPGPVRRYATPTELIAVNQVDNERLLIAVHGGGLLQFTGGKFGDYRARGVTDSNRLLRDRDGGLWIGTVERGLIHLHQGRTDVFRKDDGLAGDVILSLFEDREGNIWVASTGGLDRFRELPVTTVSTKQGLSSDATQSVLAASDGSIWIGAHEGLTRWKGGKATIFRKASGLPDDAPQSLYEDDGERMWVSTRHGLAYFKDGRFVCVTGVPGGLVHFMTGDKAGNLWLSEHHALMHLLNGHLVEQIPWSELGRRQSAEVLVAGSEPGGLWLGFWVGGGIGSYKDHQLRATYTVDDGLGKGAIPDLRVDSNGALWAASQEGGLSRIKDGRIATLSTRNGLPCDSIHWTIEDNDRSLWLYTACGLVRITSADLDAWIADPKRSVGTTVWDSADGVRLRSSAASEFGPRVAKSANGKLWFLTGEGIQVVDPHRLVFNGVPPPVHIERLEADGKQVPLAQGVHLPASVRDVSLEYTALSLVAPEKVRFKYMLVGQDPDWEVTNDRHAHYSNLGPRKYRFRVIACNNSGAWNTSGDSLEFTVDPAFYETNAFRALCGAALLVALWMAWQLRLRSLQRQYNIRLDERTRIARELHDTLLQSFQGLMFSFQAVRNLLPTRTDQAIRALDEAIRDGDEAIAEGRSAIQGLRVETALESSLERLLTTVAAELARSSSRAGEQPEFRLIVEGARQQLSPLFQDEVYRIAREILRNAFHHARANRIEAEIAYDSQFFRLRIRDDGTGIDRKVLEQGARYGHWGLPGVRERAKRIGVQLTLWSEPGAGTEVDLTTPARIAYSRMHRRERWWGFRRLRVQPPLKRE
jgi:signal transduction histidine kinase/ligand-binding sensor domain-containing protein